MADSDAQKGLRKAFGTSDDNNTYEPQKSFLDKVKTAVGVEPDPLKRRLQKIDEERKAKQED